MMRQALPFTMQPRTVINLDEPIGKTVGRRKPPVSPAGMQETRNQFFASQGHFLCPRGVYRFKTHREKDIPDLIFLRQQYPEVVTG